MAQAAGLARAFLDRLAPYGPAPVLAFAYFLELVSLAVLAGKGAISENITIALGTLGLGGLVAYFKHAERMSKVGAERMEKEAEREVVAGKEQREAARARLPPPQQSQLPLDLAGARVGGSEPEGDDDRP